MTYQPGVLLRCRTLGCRFSEPLGSMETAHLEAEGHMNETLRKEMPEGAHTNFSITLKSTKEVFPLYLSPESLIESTTTPVSLEKK